MDLTVLDEIEQFFGYYFNSSGNVVDEQKVEAKVGVVKMWRNNRSYRWFVVFR